MQLGKPNTKALLKIRILVWIFCCKQSHSLISIHQKALNARLNKFNYHPYKKSTKIMQETFLKYATRVRRDDADHSTSNFWVTVCKFRAVLAWNHLHKCIKNTPSLTLF